MDEDTGRAHTGRTSQAMAAIGMALIALLRNQGCKSIAGVLRHYNAQPKRAIELLDTPPSALRHNRGQKDWARVAGWKLMIEMNEGLTRVRPRGRTTGWSS